MSELNPHPYYGPCDSIAHGKCAECMRIGEIPEESVDGGARPCSHPTHKRWIRESDANVMVCNSCEARSFDGGKTWDGGARELELAAQEALRLLETMDNEMYLPFRAEVKKTVEALRAAVDRRKR
jgi:hypothetical protein